MRSMIHDLGRDTAIQLYTNLDLAVFDVLDTGLPRIHHHVNRGNFRIFFIRALMVSTIKDTESSASL